MNFLKKIIYKSTSPFACLCRRLFKPKIFGAHAIVLYSGNILLVKNIGSNFWSIPGGKTKRRESCEKSIFRELKEKLSISVSEVNYKLGQYFSEKEERQDYICVYVIRILSPLFQVGEGLSDAKWFPITDLPENLGLATSKRLNEFLNGVKNLISAW